MKQTLVHKNGLDFFVLFFALDEAAIENGIKPDSFDEG